jgi:hypothetical protein
VRGRWVWAVGTLGQVDELQKVAWQWPRLEQLRQREMELLGDVASYVWRTCKLLVSPSLERPLAYREDVTVHLKVISDHGDQPK